MHEEIKKVLLSEEQIHARIRELGDQLTKDYAGLNPIFVGVLKGVVIFYSDMVRAVDLHCELDFMRIKTYQNTEAMKEPKILLDVSCDLEGRHVVILEDIFDTGRSLQFTYDYLMTRKPASLRICTLLDKPERRQEGITVKPDYTGFVIPNEFVVGYGLDYNEHFRNLPYVGVPTDEAVAKYAK